MFYQAIRTYGALLIIFLISAFPAAGQGFYHKQYTYTNGLPTMGVYNVYCAADGLIWMGSDIGLIQFDGATFTTFTTENGLPDTEVIALLGDTEGRIWCITFNEKIFYVQHNVVYNSGNSTLVAEINKRLKPVGFNIGIAGEVLIYAKDDMLSIRGEEITAIPFKYADQYDLIAPVVKWNNKQYIMGAQGKTHVYFMFQDEGLIKIPDTIPFPLDFWSLRSYGNQVIVTESGIISENGERWLPNTLSASKTNANNVFIDKQNMQWYFNQNRGLQYQFGDTVYYLFEHAKVNSMDQDFEGNYWITTMADGLFMLPYNFLEKRLFDLSSDVHITLINAIELDKHNQLWAGNTFDQNFIVQPNGRVSTMSISNQQVFSRIIDYALVQDMIVVAADNKLVGIAQDTYTFITDFEARSVKSLSVKHENVFAAALSYGVIEYAGSNKEWSKNIIYDQRAYCVQYDTHGDLWFSTSSGLFLYDGEKKQHIQVPELTDKRIVDIAFHPGYHLLIISTDGYGIYALHADTYALLWTLRTVDGLSSDICRKVQVQGDTLWISSPMGLNCVRILPEGRQYIRTIQDSDGFPGNDIKDYIVDQNTLYIAGSFGVMRWANFMNPRHAIPPKFVMHRLASERGIYQPGNTVYTTYLDGYLSVDYALIAYAVSPPKLFYQLNDGKWQPASGNHIDINNLDVGNHTLKLRFLDRNEWVYPIEPIGVYVEAPFYRQSWFVPLLIVVSLISIAAYIIYIINLQRKKALNQLQLNEALTFAEQQSLQSMMNPHFIFNAINSVQQYIINNDKKEANRYLTQFARLIRINLETSKQKYISLEEELERLNLYFQFEQVRFGEQLQYSVHCPEDLRTDMVQIPSMIIQPFVENAIWHGIMPKRKPGKVELSLVADDSKLLITVRDNGMGYQPNAPSGTSAKKSSLGMHITKRRLELLTKNTGKPHFFTIQAMVDEHNQITGTIVEIHVPLELRAV